MGDELTHVDARGNARMVDVGDKEVTRRSALARGTVRMQPETLALLRAGTAPKGDVLAAARIAGIMAAKKTPELIPLCHAIALTSVELELTLDDAASAVQIAARAHALDRTGVEMEALTAVSVAALTVYDMLKAKDRAMSIDAIALHEKSGGKSGDYRR
jgi:cyclic pyranopterin phosphate synthase